MKKLLATSMALLFSVSVANAKTEQDLVNEDLYMSFHTEKSFVINGQKVVLKFANTGGTACPGQYYFKVKGKITNLFGTCSDMAKAKQSGNKIIVTMPDYDGISRQYVFENGRVRQVK